MSGEVVDDPSFRAILRALPQSPRHGAGDELKKPGEKSSRIRREPMSISVPAERLSSVTAPSRDRRGRERSGWTAPVVERDTTMGFRVIVTTGLATLYVAGCLAALSLLLSMWASPL